MRYSDQASLIRLLLTADYLQPYEAVPLVVESRRVPSGKSGLGISKLLRSLRHDDIKESSDVVHLLYDSGMCA